MNQTNQRHLDAPARKLVMLRRGNDKRTKHAMPGSQLYAKLGGDVGIATGVTFVVAPFLTVVDKAIVQSAAGSHTLVESGLQSVQSILRSPVSYFRSPTFLMMWGVYAATYSTANCLKTLSEHTRSSQETPKVHATPASWKLGIFGATTLVNSSASLLKDKAYAQMFGSVSAAVPRMSYGVWIARDFSVIGSSFVAPEIVTKYLVEKYEVDYTTALSCSEFTLPVLAQLIAGPLHFLGLDFANRNLSSKGWSEAIVDRSRALYRGFVSVVSARIARIAPGYGIGGVFNTRLRATWNDYIIAINDNTIQNRIPNINPQRLTNK